jgi:hypothetical protein
MRRDGNHDDDGSFQSGDDQQHRRGGDIRPVVALLLLNCEFNRFFESNSSPPAVCERS